MIQLLGNAVNQEYPKLEPEQEFTRGVYYLRVKVTHGLLVSELDVTRLNEDGCGYPRSLFDHEAFTLVSFPPNGRRPFELAETTHPYFK